jgi:hypothetical protein
VLATVLHAAIFFTRQTAADTKHSSFSQDPKFLHDDKVTPNFSDDKLGEKFSCHIQINTVIKGKAVPLQAWSGPEGSRKLRFPDFMTTAQDGSKVVSLTHRPPLPPGNKPGTHFC